MEINSQVLLICFVGFPFVSGITMSWLFFLYASHRITLYLVVHGKLESIRGIVRKVNKNFKLKVADYKKVISVADTNVSGQMHMAGSHFVSFDASVLPYEKIRTWYLPPVKPEDEYETGNDDTVIVLDKLGDMKVSQTVWERGREYYMDNHVRYIYVDNGHGRAIVEGEHAYEVEFDFADGEIRNLICSCPSSNN